MSDHGHFSSYKGHKERRTGKIRGAFQGCTGLWTAGCWLARRLHQLKAPPPRTSVFQFPYFCTMRGLDKLGFVDQNWLERNLSSLLLRTLVVGRRQQSESIEAALDMQQGGLMIRFDIGRCHCLQSRITFCRDLDPCWSE